MIYLETCFKPNNVEICYFIVLPLYLFLPSFSPFFVSSHFFSLTWTESAVDRRIEFVRKRLKSYFHSGNWAGDSKSSCPFADDDDT